jgi:hypothetical protein
VPRVVARTPTPPPGALAFGAAPGGSVEPEAPGPFAGASDGEGDVDAGFAALLGDSIVPPPPSPEEKRDVVRPSQKGLAPPTSVPGEPSPLEVALRSVPLPSADTVQEQPGATIVAPVAEPAVPRPPRPERRVPKVDDSPAVDFGDAVLSALGGDEPAPRPRSVSLHPVVAIAPDAAAPAVTAGSPKAGDKEAEEAAAGAKEPSAPTELTEGVVAEKAEASASDSSASSEATAILASASESSASGEATEEAAKKAAMPSPEPTEPAVGESARTSAPSPAGKSAGSAKASGGPARASGAAASPATGQEEAGSWMGGVAVALIAGASTFALFHALSTGERVAPRPASVASAAPEAPRAEELPTGAPTVAASRVEPAALGVVATVEELALPAGLAVQPDRGLLEVESGADASISVDGVVLGAGPLRQLPVREGSHEVHVQSAGADVTRTVDVKKGRRTRVAVTSAR